MIKKKITLAGMWKRIAAHGIDLGCTLLFTAIFYFALVLPLSIDPDAVAANRRIISEGQLASSLYIEFPNDTVGTPYDGGGITSIDGLSSSSLTISGTIVPTHALDNLYSYYTEKRTLFFDDKPLLTNESFQSTVLAVGKETSNIESFYLKDNGHYAITVIDATQALKSLKYVNAAYNNAVEELMSSPDLAAANADNNARQLFMIWMLAPTAFLCSLIFELLIPLFLPYGKTLGKLAMRLVVLNGAGYDIKKIQLLPRAIAYGAIEMVGGVLSFGAAFLISYTMTQFTKKHRSIHDLIAYTVVADERESFWFHNRVDEEEWQWWREEGTHS